MTDKNERVEIQIPSASVTVADVRCPNGCDLMVPDRPIHGHPSIGVRISFGEKSGMIYLDPAYGSFDNQCDVEIPEGEVVRFDCPHCGASLLDEEEICQTCSAPLFTLHLPKGGIVEGCLRKGCFYHRLRIVDLDAQFVRLYKDELSGTRTYL